MAEPVMRVVVRFQFEGVHSWPKCDLDEVSFLKHPHRHVFHVEASKIVSHDDRDVEIIMLKRRMESYSLDRFKGPHDASCEMMARDLLDEFGCDRVSVLEDGENGAEVSRA